jgi:hypothetical protein
MPANQAVRKLGEILKAMAQSEIFRDFFASKRSEASKKRTKKGRVKTRPSFLTAWCAGMTASGARAVAIFIHNGAPQGRLAATVGSTALARFHRPHASRRPLPKATGLEGCFSRR